MSEMFYVIKVFLFSAMIIAILQIKIGDHNLEQHSQNWLHSSSLVHILNSVSISASRAISNGYHFVRGEMGARLGSNDPKENKKTAAAAHHGLDIRHEIHKLSSEAKSLLDKEAAQDPVDSKKDTNLNTKDIKMIDESEL